LLPLWYVGKRTESHRTKSHKTPRTKSHNLYFLPWRTKSHTRRFWITSTWEITYITQWFSVLPTYVHESRCIHTYCDFLSYLHTVHESRYIYIYIVTSCPTYIHVKQKYKLWLFVRQGKKYRLWLFVLGVLKKLQYIYIYTLIHVPYVGRTKSHSMYVYT
jgi:hypothetical protein